MFLSLISIQLCIGLTEIYNNVKNNNNVETLDSYHEPIRQ